MARIIPLLKFGKGNAKLGKKITTFSLPSGYACPMAHACLSKAHKVTGKITDGKHTQFRCFSASQEALYTNVRDSRWHNFDALKGLSVSEMYALINISLPSKASVVRIHVAGDFFSQDYFDAWLAVAEDNPTILFYAYTKSLPYWIKRIGDIPTNLVLTASRGGRKDNLIDEHGLKEARVVFSVEEAESLGLPIDHDDSHAYDRECGSFALLIHGTQPAGSKAASAKRLLNGEGSYPRK